MVCLPATLRKRLTACLAAAALAFTSLAASTSPARANDDALVKFLLGATAIAIIAAGTSKSRGKSQSSKHAHPHHYHHAPRHAVFLPAHCQTSYRSKGKTYRAYKAGCLHHAGMRHLPHACLVSTHHGHVYRGHCLAQHGYRHR
jgi:hypothetical protein